MQKNKLLLIDAYAFIYRSYYAFIKSPRINSKGQNTSAIFGFINTLEDVLKKEKPTHIAIAFDPPGGTFRHKEYKDYKASREATPEDIKKSIPIIKEIIDAYNIPIIEVEGYEADDVIGTISKSFRKQNIDIYMMTPDKDYAQLTEQNIFMYKPKYGSNDFELLNDKNIAEKYNISSSIQIIDLLGLMGDTSDNIPGCPGIGPKTAEKLILEYGSIDNLLKNTNNLKPSLKDKIETNKEQIIFSRFLATIKTDIPLEIYLSQLIIKERNIENIKKIFEELEFKSLINRLFPSNVTILKNQPIQGLLFNTENDEILEEEEDNNISYFDNISSINVEYKVVKEISEIEKLVSNISSQKEVCFDTETTGTDPITCEIVGISFSYQKNKAFYIPIKPNPEEANYVLSFFKEFFQNENITKVGQNIKYDILVLRQYNIEVKGPLFDTMIAHYLLNPELKHSMDYMAETYLNYQTVHIEDLIEKKDKNQKSMRDVPLEDIYRYACEDADITLQLKNFLQEKINKSKDNLSLYDIEFYLIYVLADMEWNGVKLNLDDLKKLSELLTKNLCDIENDITNTAGYNLNINSPKQVGELLFEKLKIIEKPQKTKTGQYSTNEKDLEKLRTKHTIVEKILEQRGLKKLLNTYIDALPLLINPKTNRIHTSFNQTITSTGRLSSTNPNLQNIPIRDEYGKEIRKVFIHEDGCKFLSADYSQIELRIMAHLSEDKNMIEAFKNDQDIHSVTASKIYKIPINLVSEDMRRKAKTANFGIIYGISPFGLSERLHIPRKEAKELIDGYFETFPKVKEYMEQSILNAKKHGYVETILGRKRYLPDINSQNSIVRGYAERNAINAPIQGSAADIIKIAMINIYKKLTNNNFKSKMILQVHDELNFNVLNEELEDVKNIVITEMEKAFPISVPLKTDCNYGNNWLEAH